MTDGQPSKFAWTNIIGRLRITMPHKCLLRNIADRAKPDGTPFSQQPYTSKEMATELQISERQVRRILTDLVQAGYVHRQPIGRHNRLTIDLDRIYATDPSPPTAEPETQQPSEEDMDVRNHPTTPDMGVRNPSREYLSTLNDVDADDGRQKALPDNHHHQTTT